MLIDAKSAFLQLTKGQHLWLRGTVHTRLTCASGVAWITFEGDAGDLLISPGNSFVLPPDKTALIGPLGGSATLGVQCERSAVRPGSRPRFGIRRMVESILGCLRHGARGRHARTAQGVGP